MNPNVLNALLAGLNQDQATELQQLLIYLAEKASDGNPSGQMPEGSVASVINKASPAVRQKIAMISDIVETPRHKPFEQPFSEADWFDRLGFDVPASLKLKAAMDGQEVAHGVLERMGGGDSKLPQSKEPSLRELLQSAYESHGGAQ